MIAGGISCSVCSSFKCFYPVDRGFIFIFQSWPWTVHVTSSLVSFLLLILYVVCDVEFCSVREFGLVA